MWKTIKISFAERRECTSNPNLQQRPMVLYYVAKCDRTSKLLSYTFWAIARRDEQHFI
ncbi:MAG: hypothetical protein WBA89_00915 [Microcoleus sp.]|uniref:hypothetical protein n=1 Tax=Microcoleus sp. TaxID=44472 RepID=UPI003C71112A